MTAQPARYNHEYTPLQLARFHLVNLANRASTLLTIAVDHQGYGHLIQPAQQVLSELTLDQHGSPATLITSEDYYRNCAAALKEARKTTAHSQPSRERTHAIQLINNSIYSIIAITKLLTIHPYMTASSDTPADTPHPPTT